MNRAFPLERGDWRARLAWLPVPLLLALILGLWVADLRTVCEVPWLMILLNVWFTWLASLCVCVLAGRGFLTNGQPGLLMFGCGSLLWGITSLVAAMLVERVNTTVTIHNIGVFLAAFCHLTGWLWHGRVARPRRWLVAGYAGTLLLSGVLIWWAMAGRAPLFFVQGHGGTVVRQAVLVLALLMFAWVGWRMILKFRAQGGAFYHWYGLGLALVATGLTGVVLLSVQGGILGWANRLTQYLGSAYLVVAAYMAVRETGEWRISLTAVREAWNRGYLILDLRRNPLLAWAARYAMALVFVMAAMGLRKLLESWLGPGLPTYITFYPAVMVVALLAGFGPGVVATMLACGTVAYWILPPAGQFAIASPIDRMALLIFTGMGLVMSCIAELYRRNRAKVIAYERETILRDSREILRRQAELVDPARAEVIAREMQRVVLERGKPIAVSRVPATAILRRVPDIAGLIVAATGLVVLAGWCCAAEPLKRLLTDWPTMKANTALCFVLAGAALVLRERLVARRIAAGLLGSVAALTLAEYLTGFDANIDQWLFRDVVDAHTLQPGRMTWATAFGFLLTSASLWLLKARSRAAMWKQQALALAVLVIGAIALLGFGYGAEAMYRFGSTGSMAVHTALAFCVLAAGLLVARPDGVVTLVAAPGPGGQLLRWLLPVVVALPVVLGRLIKFGVRKNWYGEDVDVALLALTMVLGLVALVGWTARVLNRSDAMRRATEEQLGNLTEVMNQAHEPMIVREPDGTIRVWNHGAELLYGWSAAEALGCRKQVLLQTAGHTMEEIDSFLAGTGHWEGELIQTARNGRQISVESRQTARITKHGRTLILESNLDITERKRAECDLQNTVQRFHHMLSSMYSGILLMTEQGRVEFINQTFCDAFGLTESPAALVGVTSDDLLAKILPAFRDTAEAVTRIREILRDNQPVRVEEFAMCGGRTALRDFVPLAVDGKSVGRMWIYTDISQRKRAEQQLREATRRLTYHVDHSPLAVIEWGADMRLTRWSGAAERIFGWSAAETLGKRMEDFRWIYQEDEAQVAEVSELLQTGANPHRFSANRNYRKDGTVIHCEWYNSSLLDESGNLQSILSLVLDVTARVQAEAERQKFVSLADQSGEFIGMCDLQFRPFYANEAAMRLVGLENLEQACRTPVPEFFFPEDRQFITEEFFPQVRRERHAEVEIRFRHLQTGEALWMIYNVFELRDATGQPVGWATVSRDITARKHAVDALRESDLRFRLATEATGVGIWEWNVLTNRIRWDNQMFQIYGITPTTDGFVDYRDWNGTVVPEDLPEQERALLEISRQGGRNCREFRIRRRNDQECRHIQAVDTVRLNAHGQIEWVLGTNLDVTQQKLAEKLLKASLAEKDVLLREIHHRVKNNLQVISSLVSLQADTLTDDGLREVFGDVRDRVRTIALVHEKLYQADNLAQINFADYAASLLHYLWHAHGSLAGKIRLTLEIAPAALPMETAVTCGLILNELAGNALKHAFPNANTGEVTVGFTLNPATNTACLQVRDNGIGLPKDLECRQARSLGLRLVGMLISQLRGTLTTASGPGTDFRITFTHNGLKP